MFLPEVLDQEFLGFRMETAEAYFFFGSRHLTRERIPQVFPQFDFAYLKQVHGCEVVEANPSQTQTADAHFTSLQGLAPVSQTADCIPILLASRTKVCAIHSGWRGCKQNIAAATRAHFDGDPVLVAAIGPHILKDSFEIGRDVALELAAPDLELPHPDPAKVRFDLTELVRRQLRSAFGKDLRIVESLEDTLTSKRFHSFRRDRERAGRQFSFVVLKR